MDSPKLQIIFEDELLLAVEKPSGIPSHTLSNPDQITVESTLKKLRPELHELAPLHRLDTGTSGVLLFSKSKNVFDQMREKFKNRKVEKNYLAWSRKKISSNQFPIKIIVPLAHHPKSNKRMIAISDPNKQSYRGKLLPAETIVHSCKSKKSADGEPIYEYQIQIITGVTHQIRVHMAHMGCPLIGDQTYLPLAERQTTEILGLRASEISFELNGKKYDLKAFQDARCEFP